MGNRAETRKGFSALQVFGIVVLVVVLTAVGTIFAARFWFFPSPFKPVMLSQQEEMKLDNKLQSFEMLVYSPENKRGDNRSSENEKLSGGHLKPEAYTEVGASRTITLTEREINALLAKNTDLADKLAIDFADNLVSARMLIPVDTDFPILGGQVL